MFLLILFVLCQPKFDFMEDFLSDDRLKLIFCWLIFDFDNMVRERKDIEYLFALIYRFFFWCEGGPKP